MQAIEESCSVNSPAEDFYQDGDEYVYYFWEAIGTCRYTDSFSDAVDVFNLFDADTYLDLGTFYIGVVGNVGVGITIPGTWDFPFGRPFDYYHTWQYDSWGDGVIKRPE